MPLGARRRISLLVAASALTILALAAAYLLIGATVSNPAASVQAALAIDNRGHLYVLDGWGGVHPVGSAPQLATTASWPHRDEAQSLALFPDGTGGYVMDANGGIHAVGAAPRIASGAYWDGLNFARAIVMAPWSSARRPAGHQGIALLARPGPRRLHRHVDGGAGVIAGRLGARSPRRRPRLRQRTRADALHYLAWLGHRPRLEWWRRKLRAPLRRRRGHERRLGDLLQPARLAVGRAGGRRKHGEDLAHRLPPLRHGDGVHALRFPRCHAGDHRRALVLVWPLGRHLQLRVQHPGPHHGHELASHLVLDRGSAA